MAAPTSSHGSPTAGNDDDPSPSPLAEEAVTGHPPAPTSRPPAASVHPPPNSSTWGPLSPGGDANDDGSGSGSGGGRGGGLVNAWEWGLVAVTLAIAGFVAAVVLVQRHRRRRRHEAAIASRCGGDLADVRRLHHQVQRHEQFTEPMDAGIKEMVTSWLSNTASPAVGPREAAA